MHQWGNPTYFTPFGVQGGDVNEKNKTLLNERSDILEAVGPNANTKTGNHIDSNFSPTDGNIKERVVFAPSVSVVQGASTEEDKTVANARQKQINAETSRISEARFNAAVDDVTNSNTVANPVVKQFVMS